MKLRYTLCLSLLLSSFASFSQHADKKETSIARRTGVAAYSQAGGQTGTTNSSSLASTSPITGVWRGFFTSGMGFFQEKYRYEVQIGQLSNNGIKGVTYSYKTTVFYGKAGLAGMYTPATRNLLLKENKLIEVKMQGGEACLMTCYLEYSKIGNVEILEGTFTSINIKTKGDCGSGRVYLEKVDESDFYKEEFIKEFEEKKKTPPATTRKPNVVVKKPKVKPVPKVNTKPGTPEKKRVESPKKDVPVVIEPNSRRKTDEVVVKPSIVEPKRVIPRELKERENKVVKVIEAEGDEILIELLDNGQIDDDTISIYHNKQLIASKKRLCHQPITLRIKVDPRHSRNEIVMVAENLGSIPPNTALMIVTVGRQRHQVFLTSTEQKNAVVVVECTPLSEDGK